MIAGEYNITMEQGSTFARLISIEQPDLTADPTGQTFMNYSLAAHTARMQIRRTIDSATPMISLTTENGRLTINPNIVANSANNNEIAMLVSAADTATLTTSGVYDLEIINTNGVVSKIIRGNVTLISEVTR